MLDSFTYDQIIVTVFRLSDLQKYKIKLAVETRKQVRHIICIWYLCKYHNA